MRKNKNVLTDETKLLIYSIIDFLLEHGFRQFSFDPDGSNERVSFIINNQNLKYTLIYNVSEFCTDLVALDKTGNHYSYLVEGENYKEDRPEEIIEIAKKLGVLND